MKILVTYYSRTETTAKIAKMIQKSFNADIEEIKEVKNHNGPIGYMKGGFEAVRKKEVAIENTNKNPSDYDLTIIGSPVWASTMASPVLTYMKKNENNFNNIALFCTCGSGGYENTLNNMEELSKKEALAKSYLKKEDFSNDYKNKVNSFIEEIKLKI